MGQRIYSLKVIKLTWKTVLKEALEKLCKRCKKNPPIIGGDGYCEKCFWEVENELQEQIRNDPYGGDDFAQYNAYEGY